MEEFSQVKELQEIFKGTTWQANLTAGQGVGRFLAKYRYTCLWGNHYPDDITNFVPIAAAKIPS